MQKCSRNFQWYSIFPLDLYLAGIEIHALHLLQYLSMQQVSRQGIRRSDRRPAPQPYVLLGKQAPRRLGRHKKARRGPLGLAQLGYHHQAGQMFVVYEWRWIVGRLQGLERRVIE